VIKNKTPDYMYLNRPLITGAQGFVGSRLMEYLRFWQPDLVVSTPSRSEFSVFSGPGHVKIDAIGPHTDWTQAVSGADIVIHLAARVHVMEDVSEDPLAEYRLVNVDGTLNLARQAADAGVRRFIFLSSIKVNGEATPPGEFFTEDLKPKPVDPYGISKYEAEEGLKAICEQTGMEYVIIRPPLIYGPGVKANYLKLVQAVKKGFPLPFGCINNKRSMLALDNLIDFIVLAANDPRAANQTFLLSDGQDLSSKDLVIKIALALGLAPRVLSVPTTLLKVLGFFLGKRAAIERLLGSLQIDSSKARVLLDWKPPISVDEGIARTVNPAMANDRK
jgi:nucleoside-diphosphate-sugar epimerase